MSKTVMHEFWYDYVKPKYGEKARLFYMDTHSFIVFIETRDIYADTAKGVEIRSDALNYEIKRPLMKNDLGGKIMTEIVAVRPKTCSYLIDDKEGNKKVGHKTKP